MAKVHVYKDGKIIKSTDNPPKNVSQTSHTIKGSKLHQSRSYGGSGRHNPRFPR